MNAFTAFGNISANRTFFVVFSFCSVFLPFVVMGRSRFARVFESFARRSAVFCRYTLSAYFTSFAREVVSRAAGATSFRRQILFVDNQRPIVAFRVAVSKEKRVGRFSASRTLPPIFCGFGTSRGFLFIIHRSACKIVSVAFTVRPSFRANVVTSRTNFIVYIAVFAIFAFFFVISAFSLNPIVRGFGTEESFRSVFTANARFIIFALNGTTCRRFYVSAFYFFIVNVRGVAVLNGTA